MPAILYAPLLLNLTINSGAFGGKILSRRLAKLSFVELGGIDRYRIVYIGFIDWEKAAVSY
jgi:hypothetical protein